MKRMQSHKSKLARLGKLAARKESTLTAKERIELNELWTWFERDRRRRNLGGKVARNDDGEKVCLADDKRKDRIIRAKTWNQGKLKPLAEEAVAQKRRCKEAQKASTRERAEHVKARRAFIKRNAATRTFALALERDQELVTALRNWHEDYANKKHEALLSIVHRDLGLKK